jgi:hypothetical protein
LKERRKLILVPRETPWNLIHARNVVTLLEAGAIVLPAIPSFYSRPSSLTAVVDTVVWRILDQIGLPNPGAYRWGKESASANTSERKNKRKSESKRTTRLEFRLHAAGTGGGPRKRGTPNKN